jgi:hypothetical protein
LIFKPVSIVSKNGSFQGAVFYCLKSNTYAPHIYLAYKLYCAKVPAFIFYTGTVWRRSEIKNGSA